jgi:L-asparaginase / beta-aspartyl-peptidase
MADETYALLVHGGYVGEQDHNWVSAESMALTARILELGRTQLLSGASAVEAVVAAIMAFEDSGLTDAGRGSFQNSEGFVETDASVMEGSTGKSGAVAGMTRIKNPIAAAQLVMTTTPHVFFAGRSGEETLIKLGAETIDDPRGYYRPIAWPAPSTESHGTVGAVALDKTGVLAAGTSTGGTHGKLAGRVGDSPVIGASTYATPDFAFSATGAGEVFIKLGVTRDIVARATYLNEPLRSATDYVVKELIGRAERSRGAVIALSRRGERVVSSTGYGVLHGFVSSTHEPTVALEAT